MRTDPRHALGRRGEDLAADFFTARGFTVVARNWTCRYGELDLVVRKQEEIRLIEVKTRADQAHGEVPHETVTRRKLSKMGEAAARFFLEHPELPDMPHFDVFTVTFRGTGEPSCQWLKDFE